MPPPRVPIPAARDAYNKLNRFPVQFDPGEVSTLIRHAGGSGTIYYKSDSTVSDTSYDGMLTSGQTLAVAQTYYLLASVRTDVIVSFYESDTIFQSTVGGYDPSAGPPNQATPITMAFSTGGAYSDPGGGNIFHLSSYAFNDQSRPTVAVFGEAKGKRVWGGNFVGYGGTSTPPSNVYGCEIDFGNLNTTNAPSTIRGLYLASHGGNVGGIFAGVDSAFVYITSGNPLSQMKYGLVFSAGVYQPIGLAGGTKIQGTLASGSNQITNVSPTSGYLNGDNITGTGIPAGTTITAGAGTSTLTISQNASASGAIDDGGAYIFTDGTGTLITATSSIVGTGIDFSGATFAIAAIRLGAGGNIRLDTTTGTKIGTATTQKLGFWNTTPVVQPSSTGETVGFTAGAGTAVTDQSTFTGNVGATAYRISDIVKHLKNTGLIAA